MALPMLSVDQVLTGVDGAPAAADLDPYLLTMVFANAAARAGRKAIPDAAGAAEYFTEESPLIASRVKVASFVDEVSLLRDAVERLEKSVPRGAPDQGKTK